MTRLRFYRALKSEKNEGRKAEARAGGELGKFLRENVLRTSTITEHTFGRSAIAAKLIRWYIRTWLSDTAVRVFIFTRIPLGSGAILAGCQVYSCISMLPKLWLTPLYNVLLHAVNRASGISMGFAFIEYKIFISTVLFTWELMCARDTTRGEIMLKNYIKRYF